MIYHDMDRNPTISQANWLEIQPLGWKSTQQKKSKKIKVLDFGHTISILLQKTLEYNLVLYGWF